MDNNNSDTTLIYPSPDVSDTLNMPVTFAMPATLVTPTIPIVEELVNKPINNASRINGERPVSLAVPWALRMPKVNHPVAEYYSEINWSNGYEQWPLCRFATPMDGSCLFHSIANGFFSPYHKQSLHGQTMTRIEIVNTLRRELARRLAEVDPEDENKRTYYACLAGGNTAIFAEAVPEFKLEVMQSQLASNAHIGYGYIEFICNALNKDVYILDAAHRDIYIFDELPFCIKGNRKSIVIYYMNGHYELVGIRTADGSFDTHFEPTHPFIHFLNGIVKEVT